MKIISSIGRIEYRFCGIFTNGKWILSGKYDKNTKFTTDDYRSKMPQFKADNIDKNKDLINLLASIAEEKRRL